MGASGQHVRRVAIVGVGMVTPLGTTAAATWDAVMHGTCAGAPIESFDTSAFASKFACEVKGFDATTFIEKRTAKHLDRTISMGAAAAIMAMADAGFTATVDDGARWGIYMGSGMGGLGSLERTAASLAAVGPRHGVSPYFVPGMICNMIPGLLSMRYGITGPTLSHVTACATGAHSIGEAMRAIRHGYIDRAIAGGAECAVTPLGLAGFGAMRALSTRNDAPAQASRPFDASRDGFVLGEGAGALVLEAWDLACARGVPILAELCGYGASSDAHHMTNPDPSGRGALASYALALDDAGLHPTQIGYINAHGTSTPTGDLHEAQAIRAGFGGSGAPPAVSSTKSMMGHTLAAAGAIETGLCVMALTAQCLPPTMNLHTPDPACDLDFVPGAARAVTDLRYALSSSFGFGGTNCALIVGHPSLQGAQQ